MRGEDGRRGKVMSIRVTDEERAELHAAAKADQQTNRHHYWPAPVAVGPWIVRAALDKARAAAATLQEGSTKKRPRAGTTVLERAIGSTGSSRRKGGR